MRSEGESHPSLANTSIQKMIKMTPVDSVFLLGVRVGWSVCDVWAAHGVHALYFLNKYWIYIFIHTITSGHYSILLLPIFFFSYYSFAIRWC